MTATSQTDVGTDRRLQVGRDAFWEVVGHNDAPAALEVVDGLLDDGLGLADVLEGIVAHTQQRVGAKWLDGEWTVAREHAATAVSEYVVRALLGRRGGPHTAVGSADHRQRPPVLVACAEREWHALPGLVVATLVADAGHPVVFLGSDVSTRTLQGALLDVPSRAVLISASLVSSLPFVRRHVETASHSGVPTLVGGSGLDPAGRWARRLGATAQAGSAAAVLDAIDALPVRVSPVAPLPGPGPVEAAMLVTQVPAIARGAMARVVRARPDVETISEGHLAEVVDDQLPMLVGAVVSGLLVDDPTVLDDTTGWLEQVLVTRGGDRSLVTVVVDAVRAELRDFPVAQRLLVA